MGRIIPLTTPKTWEDHLSYFILRKKASGIAPRTVRDYQYLIPHFFQAHPDALASQEKLASSVLKYFARDVKPATFNNRRIYLKVFFDYLVNEGVIEKNPIDFPRRRDDGRARAVTPEVLRLLLEAPDRKTYTGLRDYCLLLFTLDTGIRPGEALQLLPDDFDLDTCEVLVREETAKTRRKRTLPLSPQAAFEIQRLLKVRPREWRGNTPVFCSQDGRPFQEPSWYQRLRKYGEKIGYKITPYDLRHSFAIMYLRNGGNIFALQRTLGHADLSMTKRYLALTQEDLRREHQKSTPLQQLTGKRVRRV